MKKIVKVINKILKLFGLHWTEGFGLVTHKEWEEANILSDYLDFLIIYYDLPAKEFLQRKFPPEVQNERLLSLIQEVILCQCKPNKK